MRICFVCLGNICRSPTAEGVFRKLVDDAGLADRVVIDSAGTGGWHEGELADPRSREAAKNRGYKLVHRARKFTAADFGKFDLILCMDRSNVDNVMMLARGMSRVPPVKLLREFDKTAHVGAEVPDPYSGDARGFEAVLDICERACRGLLEVVRERV